MKVKCLFDRINPEIHEKWLVDWANTLEQLELTVGKIYVVLAISRYSDKLYYYIMGDESDNYPLAFPIELFEIYDSQVSKYWDCNLSFIKSFKELKLQNHEVCSFTKWKMEKDLFYEKILEEDKQTLLIFNSFKDKMITEYLRNL